MRLTDDEAFVMKLMKEANENGISRAYVTELCSILEESGMDKQLIVNTLQSLHDSLNLLDRELHNGPEFLQLSDFGEYYVSDLLYREPHTNETVEEMISKITDQLMQGYRVLRLYNEARNEPSLYRLPGKTRAYSQFEDAFTRWNDANRRLFQEQRFQTMSLRYSSGGPSEPIQRLRARITNLKSTIDALCEVTDLPSPTSESVMGPTGKRVFIVHGHDEGAREAVARLLERLGLEPVILSEQRGSGSAPIFDIFQEQSDGVAYAVVIITPDDRGGSVAASEQRTRARQNVVFELGYVLGRLGQKRVSILNKAIEEFPSDVLGNRYIRMQSDSDLSWKTELAQEIDAAGIAVDLKNVR